MIEIMLVDDHAILRDSLAKIINSYPNMRVVSSISDATNLDIILAQVKPHIVLLDITMPTVNGLDVLAQVSKDYFDTKFIILSSYNDVVTIVRALQRGARGYLSKNNSMDELISAINTVASGDIFLPKTLDSETLININLMVVDSVDPLSRLTKREKEVLQLASEGLTYAEIAHKLTISRRTVEAHRLKLMKKLNLLSQTELVKFAIRNKITSDS